MRPDFSVNEPVYRHIARALIEAHGIHVAVAFAQQRSKEHSDVHELEGAAVWRRIADAARECGRPPY